MKFARLGIEALGPSARERLILLILAAVQFTTIVDFMIVMPLGPQLMRIMSIGPQQFGLIVSSYTFAAGLAGLVAASVVDRFARRSAFLFLYGGFLLGTLCCALAPNYQALIAARLVTGGFGGILGGMTMAIIGDVFPEHRRGRATGSLMSGFALASVAGVPFGLMLGTAYGWHIPFFVLVIGGIPILLLARCVLPPLQAHVGHLPSPGATALLATFSHPNHLNAFALIATLMIGGFAAIPYLPAYLVSNVGMNERYLPMMYIVGGGLTLIAAPIVGRIADRYGKLATYRVIAPLSALLLLAITHLPQSPALVAVTMFGGLMMCNAGRMIPAMAMVTSCVAPNQRGAFLSANSSVQHVASGLGTYVGGLIVVPTANGGIDRLGIVGWLAATVTLMSLWLAGRIRVSEGLTVSAEAVSYAAAAEANVDSGEPLLGCNEANA